MPKDYKNLIHFSTRSKLLLGEHELNWVIILKLIRWPKFNLNQPASQSIQKEMLGWLIKVGWAQTTFAWMQIDTEFGMAMKTIFCSCGQWAHHEKRVLIWYNFDPLLFLSIDV